MFEFLVGAIAGFVARDIYRYILHIYNTVPGCTGDCRQGRKPCNCR